MATSTQLALFGGSLFAEGKIMTTSPTGRQMIEGFEGLETKAYQDQRGIWTLGYGHIAGVKQGDTCTKEQADEWLEEDLASAEKAVNAMVKALLNQNQFDALVSFTYNVGSGSLEHSTLLSLLNQGAIDGAANQFLAWDHINGVVSDGLLRRRTAERALFLQA